MDESTVRKKLREYEELGLLVSERRGRELAFHRADNNVDLESWKDAIAFFSEEDSLGVIGSFLLDKSEEQPDYFRFKHHYILHAMDSQVLCALLTAIQERRAVRLSVRNLRNGHISERTVCPLKLYVSAQNGRQYLLGYHYPGKKLVFTRVDAVESIETGNVETKFEDYLAQYERFRNHLWGVSTGPGHTLEHLEMTIRVEDGEGYIPRRLEREKRHGSVEQVDAHTWRFAADVYDAGEMLPWVRTFIGRIVNLQCSNQSVADTFYADLGEMAGLYRGGEADAVQ